MSFFLNPAFACDYYKTGHPFMQPPGMQTVYSTWTARSYKHHPDCPKTVIFGHQYTIKEFFVDYWQKNFFDVPLEQLEQEYREMIEQSFNPTYISFDKFAALHALGYLPIEIWGVLEGTLLPVGIPDHVIFNTHPDFAWLPQFLEDVWSSNNWLPSTSATTAYYRRKLLKPFVEATCDDMSALDHMCGDFSLRGHTSLQAGAISGAAHLLSFDRTATIGANALIKQFYGDEVIHGIGTPSLEHSVVEQGVAWFKMRLATNDIPEYMQRYVSEAMYQGNWEINLIAEMCFMLYLMEEVQPAGVMTYVSDTYDYWGVVSKIVPTIKDYILGRKGCLSIRPDSGNPVNIICGDSYAKPGTPEYEGTLSLLFDIFHVESTYNSKGCLELPPQIRMIYGDAITADITKSVGNWCKIHKVAISNVCFGIGAYTYQYVTRDTRGYAIKATDCVHEKFGEIPIYKQPKTDAGKKSPRGCVSVELDAAGNYICVENLTLEESFNPRNLMVCKLKDGQQMNQQSFADIKAHLRGEEGRDWTDSADSVEGTAYTPSVVVKSYQF